LSTLNVHTLLYADRVPDLYTFPEFIQLLDDDIVSLTALTLIMNPDLRDVNVNVSISQLTLSLYLMTQCQLKLRDLVTSLAQTLDYIKVAHRRHPVWRTLDRLVLKMIARKTVTEKYSQLHDGNHLVSRSIDCMMESFTTRSLAIPHGQSMCISQQTASHDHL